MNQSTNRPTRLQRYAQAPARSATALQAGCGQINQLSILKRLWLCMFLALLFLRSAVSIFLSEENRLYFQWVRGDALGVLLAIALVGCGLFVVSLVLERFGRYGRIALEWGFIIFALFYIKVALGEMLNIGAGVSLMMKLLLAVVVVSAFFRRKAVVRYTRIVCLVFSPVLLVFAGFLVTARPIVTEFRAESFSPASPAKAPAKPGNVFIFLFDQWSYWRTFEEDGSVRKEFKNIKRVAGMSTVFHNAYSASAQTESSLPGLFCGKVGESRIADGTYGILQTNGETVPLLKMDNVFEAWKDLGYRTAMYGSVLSLAEMLRKGVDISQSQMYDRMFDPGWKGTFSHVLIDALRTRFGRHIPLFGKKERMLRAEKAYKTHLWLHDVVMKEVRTAGASFLFAHYWVPHWPYVLDRNGLRDDAWKWSLSLNVYESNLQFLDRVVGELLAGLEERSDFNDTMFVMLSDHNFQADPLLFNAERKEFCRIPVMVHFPGQSRRINVNEQFSTAWLKEILEGCLDDGELGLDAFLKKTKNVASTREIKTVVTDDSLAAFKAYIMQNMREN